MRKFRWLLTPEGGAWPDKGAAAVALAAAAAPDDQASFRNDLALLGTLDEWLRANSDFGLDLALLEQTGILKTPPQWSYVKQALVRAGSDKERELDDRHAIQAYATMLRDRSLQFDRALLIAAVGRCASTSSMNARRTRDALQALSESLVREAKPKLLVELKPPPASLIAHREALDAFRKWADGLSLEPDFADLVSRSWARWLRNFDLWWSQGDSVFPFEFEDYLLRVHGTGPPSLLGEDLAAMSLYQWTYLTAPPSPGWLRGSAWHALGFDQEAVAVLNVGSPDELEVSKAWTSRLADAQADGPQDYWLLVISDAGPARNWLPEKQYPTLAFKRSEVVTHVPPSSSLARGSLVELVGSLEEVKAAADRPFPAIPIPPSALPPAYFGAVKLPKRPAGAPAYLYNPRSVGDAVRKLTALHEQRTPAPRRAKTTAQSATTAAKSIPIDIGSLPEVPLTVGEQSYLTLIASKGSPPYHWFVTSGMVPPGMRMAEGGVIEGTPTAPGPFQFTVRAVDSEGNFGDHMFGVMVQPAPPRS